MATKILGLSGYARSGKDTFASALLPHGWTRVAFADGVREAALALDPLIPTPSFGNSPFHRLSDVVDRVGWEIAKQNGEVRRTLQRMGTEVGRALDPNTWVRMAARKVDDIAGPVVITDVRFPNEADFIRATGFGRVVRINRPGIAAVNAHASDSAMDDYLRFDAVVENELGVEELAAFAPRLVEALWPTEEVPRAEVA